MRVRQSLSPLFKATPESKKASISNYHSNMSPLFRNILLFLITISLGWLLYDEPLPPAFVAHWQPLEGCPAVEPGLPAPSSVLRYSVMFDAGSTGSRVHIYAFDVCRPEKGPASVRSIVGEIYEATTPGLSSYAKTPELGGDSLFPLLDLAKARLPPREQQCVPLAVKATAGLRLLPDDSAERVLQDVRHELAAYPFQTVSFKDVPAVSIMDGSDEGVYAWITVNFLLKRIGRHQSDASPTAMIMDLGGASTQIVFEPPESQLLVDKPDQYKRALRFGPKEHVVYQYSHLGYGLMEARKRVLKEFFSKSKAQLGRPFVCVSSGLTLNFDKDSYKAQIVQGASYAESVTGSGDAEKCKLQVLPLLKRDEPCPVKPCAVGGVFMPSVSDLTIPVYIFSYFYDRLIPLGLPEQITVGDIWSAAIKVCSYQYESSDASLNKLLSETPLWCLDLVYMYVLIHDGYGLPDSKVVHVTKKLDGYETGWALGAALHMVERHLESGGDLSCLS